MWEVILVGLIVLVATLYTSWRLLPASLRLRTARRIAEWGQRPGRAAWLRRASASVAARAHHGVGACGDCGAVQATPKPPVDRSRR
ncbi:MAG: hypothetical protein NDI84_03705 [Steroidobacteraceae bacterium]|jgi:hypothetical protein|nr:hypothetical protein [Steroidobacteraceae bacterium]